MADYSKYIEGLKNKDEESFNYIYEESRHTVYAAIYAIVRDHAASQDIMQETYLTMLEKIYQYRPEYRFLSWLTTIARNKAIDYYRRQKKELRVDIEEMGNIMLACAPVGESRALIEEMLDRLNETERSIYLLRVVKQLKNREIAEIMGMPLGTVLWHYSRAVKKLKGR